MYSVPQLSLWSLQFCSKVSLTLVLDIALAMGTDINISKYNHDGNNIITYAKDQLQKILYSTYTIIQCMSNIQYM